MYIEQVTLIPKKIHYCWLSGEEMPMDIIKCIDTWKKIMPEYELILWDKNKFDITSVPFVKGDCHAQKWAFAADYIRLYALFTEGGIYMDTDVYVKKVLTIFYKMVFLHHWSIIKKKRQKKMPMSY
jgi:mannosyltransferase OCH1-like enzyme